MIRLNSEKETSVQDLMVFIQQVAEVFTLISSNKPDLKKLIIKGGQNVGM